MQKKKKILLGARYYNAGSFVFVISFCFIVLAVLIFRFLFHLRYNDLDFDVDFQSFTDIYRFWFARSTDFISRLI